MSLHTHNAHDETDAFIASLQAKSKRNTILLTITGALILAATGFFFLERPIRRAWRDHQISSQSKTPLDAKEQVFANLHTKLIPTWAIHHSRATDDDTSKTRAKASWKKLHTTLNTIPAGRLIFEDIYDLTSDPTMLIEHNKELMQKVKAWNRFMDRTKQPWWIDANIFSSPQNTFFYIKSYKILANVHLHVGEDSHRTRFTARADRTNVHEVFLGHTSPHQDGAIILADRLYDFALRDLWPLLDPELDAQHKNPRRILFAPRVRQEILDTISRESAQKLKETAYLRLKIEHIIQDINARHDCGSTFSLLEVPWDGIPDRVYKTLRSFAKRDAFKHCKSISKTEAEILIETSKELKAQDLSLHQAVRELVAFAARSVATHEARHAQDHLKADSFNTPLPCTPCDGVLRKRSRAELSAYLGSFAHQPTAYTSLYQACSINRERGTPHAYALNILLPKLGPEVCVKTLIDNLSKRAVTLEHEFFGRSESITLPKDFPNMLELYSRQ